MHMHPMDTRTTDQEHDYIEDYKSGSSLTALHRAGFGTADRCCRGVGRRQRIREQ